MEYISPLSLNIHFPKRLALMGSTGTIGTNALKIIQHSKNFFEVYALAGGKNIEKLAEQANEFEPKFLAIQFEEDIKNLKKLLKPHYKPEILSGKQGYSILSSLPDVDMVLSAQVGASGIDATISAVNAGKQVALANKESLVLAGSYIRQLAQQKNATIIPVDSEHYALFQCLAPHKNTEKNVKKLILTASGGPFHGKDKNFLENVQVEDALKHPNWKMGAKITIDSATLMNKGLEVIEACHLYGIPLQDIDVLVHQQSIVHSLVAWNDGSITAQLAVPDMKLPICAAFSFPKMLTQENNCLKDLDLTLQSLSFDRPNKKLFSCLELAYQAFKDNICIELNAANEIAVKRFLQKNLSFLQIPMLISDMLNFAKGLDTINLSNCTKESALAIIYERDTLIREKAKKWNN